MKEPCERNKIVAMKLYLKERKHAEEISKEPLMKVKLVENF